MSDELITTQVEVVGTPVTEEIAKPGEEINVAPDPAALKAEVDRLEAVRKKAEEDARYWRDQKAQARAEYFKSKNVEPKPPIPPVEDLGLGRPPSKDDFDDYDKFVDAKIAYETAKAKSIWEREQQEKHMDEKRREKELLLREKITLGYQEFPDFEDVAMNETVPITPMVMDVLSEFENPHRIAYYLGKNRAEAIQISRMTPVQATRAIARIEDMIIKQGIIPTPPKIPKAPPPINPIGGSNPTVEKDPEKMSQKEFEAKREREGARRF